MGEGSNKSDVEVFVSALKEISKKYQGKQKNWILQIPSLATEMVMMPRDVFLSNSTTRVALDKAVGHVAAQALHHILLFRYLSRGRITKEIVDYLKDMSSRYKG